MDRTATAAFDHGATPQQKHRAFVDAGVILEPTDDIQSRGPLGDSAALMALMLAHMTADAMHRRGTPAQAAVVAPHLRVLTDAMALSPLDTATRVSCAQACRALADLAMSAAHS